MSNYFYTIFKEKYLVITAIIITMAILLFYLINVCRK